ncbi:hypothetical protein [Sphingomonas faeni]|uniref:hypothetical protein n=1 Tax=Sphingomonas faeni TaxID=185950 RepID=UPI0020BF32E6|nr:hypothetical protein [Sphingomonas faeni]MCK8457891.1 hypothetical protein [Sphingomonas faeni]
MLHLYDRTSAAHALTLGLDRQLHRLLTKRIAALGTPYGDVTDHTEFLVVEPFDTEADIVRHIGFSPLVEPFDGFRFGEPDFHPGGWDWLAEHGGWYEMVVTFGSTFAYILLIQDKDGVIPELRRLCRRYVAER